MGVGRRGEPKGELTIIGHLHDLAALKAAASFAKNLRELVLVAVAVDVG